ncbi:MAG: M48 family metallopeptidase [Oligoflexia bacterium]|nr:M48 family metallopeptidase [Oligoflexia bacterium]
MKYVPKPDLDNPNVSKSHPLIDLAFLLGGVTALALIALFAFQKFGERLVVLLPAEKEAAWLKNLSVEKEFFKVSSHWRTERELNELLNDLIKKTQFVSPYNFNVKIVCDETPNAFAIPGGKIMVTSGLLERLKTKNGLVFTLSHELGHFKGRHHLKKIIRSVGMSFFTSLAGFESQSQALTLVSGLLNLSFDREQELAADLLAIELSKKYFGGLNGASELFEVLSKEESLSSSIPSWFLTHPHSEERIKVIRENSNENQNEIEKYQAPGNKSLCL